MLATINGLGEAGDRFDIHRMMKSDLANRRNLFSPLIHNVVVSPDTKQIQHPNGKWSEVRHSRINQAHYTLTENGEGLTACLASEAKVRVVQKLLDQKRYTVVDDVDSVDIPEGFVVDDLDSIGAKRWRHGIICKLVHNKPLVTINWACLLKLQEPISVEGFSPLPAFYTQYAIHIGELEDTHLCIQRG